ncbi:hypothetical protein Tco_1143953 [Tanacetum coccineum]
MALSSALKATIALLIIVVVTVVVVVVAIVVVVVVGRSDSTVLGRMANPLAVTTLGWTRTFMIVITLGHRGLDPAYGFLSLLPAERLHSSGLKHGAFHLVSSQCVNASPAQGMGTLNDILNSKIHLQPDAAPCGDPHQSLYTVIVTLMPAVSFMILAKS